MAKEIQCIMFCEFDPIAGPKIAYQSPEDFIGKEQFDSITTYIITKPQLQQRLITIKALDYRFVGVSIGIENDKYSRNALLFNVCFVLEEECAPCKYEGVVKKLAGYLTTLELESGFLSKDETKKKIPAMLDEILHGLTMKGECNIQIDEWNTIYLKVCSAFLEHPVVQDHQAPVFLWDKRAIVSSHWDLTAQQILPYINGCNHIQKIASIADMDLNLVRIAVQTLVYYGVVSLIPVFLYSNMYSLNPEINKLAKDQHMQDECVKYVSLDINELPKFRDVFMLYCAMGPGVTIRDFCARHDPVSLKVDVRLLVQYGLIKGFIHRLNKYPILVAEPGSQKLKSLGKWLNGQYSCDEICCKSNAKGEPIRYEDLDKITEDDPSVVCIWK